VPGPVIADEEQAMSTSLSPTLPASTPPDRPILRDAPTPARSAAPARHILITGASGALGGALACARAKPCVALQLWGRDLGRLAATADACRAAGAEVTVRSLDLADIGAMLAAIAEADAATPFDEALLVAGQGDTAAADARVEDAAQVARLVQVNFAGPAALAAALADRMAARGHGRIVLIGSAAAFHALPFAPAYAGSKAGLARFADALRLAVRGSGVQVTLVSPGFIDWPGGGRPVPRALLMSLPTAVRRVLAAADRGQAHAIIPWPFAVLRLIDRLLPAPWRDRLLLALKPQ